MKSFRIYLSGSVRKGSEDKRSDDYFWTEKDEETIRALVPWPLELLNPAKTEIDRNDVFLNYGCDLALVSSSDAVLVDLRREKGIGIGAELMHARRCEIPVIAFLPPNSHYHRAVITGISGQDVSEWIHPFVYGLCDFFEPTLDSICATLVDVMNREPAERKVAPTVGAAIEYYKRYSDRRGNERYRSSG